LVHKGKVSTPLAFGIAMHEGLGTYYSPGGTLQPALAAFIKSYEKEGDRLDLEEYGVHRQMGQDLLASYDTRDYVLDDFSVMQVESRFAVILGENCYNCNTEYKCKEYQPDYTHCQCGMPIFGLAGQADLIVNRNDKIVVNDHKTSKGASNNYMASWGHDFGMIGYCYGVKKTMNHNVRQFGMNIIKKLKTVGKTTKVCPDCRNGKRKKLDCVGCNTSGHVPMEPPKAFYREYFNVTPQDYAMMKNNRIALGLQMYDMQEKFKGRRSSNLNHIFPMHSIACHKYGRECDYVDLCWNNDPDNLWFEFPDNMLAEYDQAPEDYVDLLVKEDME
jgi:hypothetical protein